VTAAGVAHENENFLGGHNSPAGKRFWILEFGFWIYEATGSTHANRTSYISNRSVGSAPA
jgi:hypothetical protein